MTVLVGNWWTFVVRGIIAIIFGLVCVFAPSIALLTLVFLFAFYAYFDGILNIIAAFRRTERSQVPWWALLISGIVGLIVGTIALFMPDITAMALLYLIAAWAVVTGVMSIVSAIRLRKQITGEWLLALSGVLAIVFGVLVAIFPGAGALAVLLWIGAFATVYGALLMVLGFKLRKWIRRAEAERLDHEFPHGVAPSH
jgi:uncharacterized membrane protein HdeD (DUF308 family)